MVIRHSRYFRLIQIALWWFCSEGLFNPLFLQAGPCFPRASNLQQGCLAFHLKLSPCLLGSAIQSLDISSPLQYPCWKSCAQIWLILKGACDVLKALLVIEKLDFKTLWSQKTEWNSCLSKIPVEIMVTLVKTCLLGPQRQKCLV